MKQKRYWLRGGIIGLIIGVVVDLWFASSMRCISSYLNADGTMGSMCPGKLDLFLTSLKVDTIYYILTLFVIILVGLLLGWLYGKIKNRNKLI